MLLHAPGKTPESTLRFVTFIVETLMGVYRHNGLLKASIMSATNAHRLGANEAPPAIISSFLGKQLSDLLDHIEQSDSEDDFIMAKQAGPEDGHPRDSRTDDRQHRPQPHLSLRLHRATASSFVPWDPRPTAPRR